jgi:hypothetical protein
MLMDLAVMLHPDHDQQQREHMARLAGRLGFIAVHVPPEVALDPEEMASLLAAAAPAMVVRDETENVTGIVRRNDPQEVRSVHAMMQGLDDARPVVVAVPISIGRTRNEAVARADRDPRFVGDAHPSVTGIFGTFEEAQEQVLALARAGADVLLLTVPDETDVADVLAQVRALVVGATPALFSS